MALFTKSQAQMTEVIRYTIDGNNALIAVIDLETEEKYSWTAYGFTADTPDREIRREIIRHLTTKEHKRIRNRQKKIEEKIGLHSAPWWKRAYIWIVTWIKSLFK